jgi:hypothetical protein
MQQFFSKKCLKARKAINAHGLINPGRADVCVLSSMNSASSIAKSTTGDSLKDSAINSQTHLNTIAPISTTMSIAAFS